MQPVSSERPSIVLFDIGNVIVDWDPVRLYTELFGDEGDARAFCANICTLDWHKAHDRGVPMDENAAPLIAAYPHQAEAIRAWKHRWLDMFDGYVPGVPQLVEALHGAGIPLYGLSNIPAEVSDITFDAFPLIRTLRDVVISGEEGVIKPDSRIYEIALERMNRPDPGQVLFVDDSIANIRKASDLGFRTHHFAGGSALRKQLVEYGLI